MTRTIPAGQSVIAGANIRALRRRNGWTQARPGELTDWPAAVCGAGGHRSGRQRGFTTREIRKLAVIFGLSPSQLTTRCATCGGHPPAGFACLACGPAPGSGLPASSAATGRARPGHGAASL